eukprot:10315440-Alexandrium_andersonii.AAC.1
MAPAPAARVSRGPQSPSKPLGRLRCHGGRPAIRAGAADARTNNARVPACDMVPETLDSLARVQHLRAPSA